MPTVLCAAFLACDVGPPKRVELCPARGDAAGYLTDVSEAAGLDLQLLSPTFRGNPIAVEDVDGDALADIIAGSRGGGFALYRNLGSLRFEDATAMAGLPTELAPTAIATGDLDNDGSPELIVAAGAEILLWRASADGFVAGPGIVATPGIEHILVADINADGALDLFLSVSDGNGGAPNHLLFGRGDLEFDDASGLLSGAASRTWTATAADLDGDGAIDVHVANDTLAVDYGTYSEGARDLPVDMLLSWSGEELVDRASVLGLATPRSSMGGIPADIDGDGALDLLIPDYGANKAMRWDGATFVEVATTLGLDSPSRRELPCDSPPTRCLLLSWGTAAEDLDLDGNLDIVVANGSIVLGDVPPPLLLYQRDGRRFREVDAGLGCFDAQALATADLDNDGDLDVVLGGREGRLRLVENTSPAGSWMRVSLVGNESNREGRGSEIRVHLSDGSTLVRVMAPGGVAFTSMPAEVHVGLGMPVDDIEVRWPSGRRERWLGPASGRISLLEGSGEQP